MIGFLKERFLYIFLFILIVILLFYAGQKYFGEFDIKKIFLEENSVVREVNDGGVNKDRFSDLEENNRGVEVLKSGERVGVLDDTIEVELRGRVLDKVYVESGFNCVDMVPNNYHEKITLVLNDSSLDSFPLKITDKNDVQAFKSTKISEIIDTLKKSNEIIVRCNIIKPEIFNKECKHEKCSMWIDDVVDFWSEWKSFMDESVFPNRIGFCVNMEVNLL